MSSVFWCCPPLKIFRGGHIVVGWLLMSNITGENNLPFFFIMIVILNTASYCPDCLWLKRTCAIMPSSAVNRSTAVRPRVSFRLHRSHLRNVTVYFCCCMCVMMQTHLLAWSCCCFTLNIKIKYDVPILGKHPIHFNNKLIFALIDIVDVFFLS